MFNHLSVGIRAMVTIVAMVISVWASGAEDNDPYSRDILILSDWFEGEFDNEEQRWFEADPRSSTPESDRVIRMHVAHKRVDLPAFGEHVFYVEEYKNNDQNDVYRQRLVTFSTDLDEGAIRMQQGFFGDPEAVRGGHVDTGKLDNITPDDVTFLPQCDVFWQRVADQFSGGMKPKACVFGEGADRRYSVHDLTLSESKYWRVDTTFRVSDDSLYVGYPIDRPVRMNRAKPFRCEVFFYAEDGDQQVEPNVAIHSQGGIARATRTSDGAKFEVLMRDKEYPYYDTRPDFIYFSIRRAGERRSIMFSVSDPDSRQLGMRNREVGAFCHREGYEFRESLGDL